MSELLPAFGNVSRALSKLRHVDRILTASAYLHPVDLHRTSVGVRSVGPAGPGRGR